MIIFLSMYEPVDSRDIFTRLYNLFAFHVQSVLLDICC